jgi:glucosamine--fructose-6-phosphate aminotransferase (isomerizing)
MSVADLLHGPIATVDEKLPVLNIDGGDAVADDMRAFLERLEAIGAPIATCTPDPLSTLPMFGGLTEVMYSVVATVRGQQLAYHLSKARGLDPDHPVGPTKVTPAY